MRYRQIQGTDLKPATICMGGLPFITGGPPNPFSLLDAYTELGGNFIDTANVYGKWLPDKINSSEFTIGRWMKERRNRSTTIIATKGGHPDLATMQISRLSRPEVAADLEESLKALQTDWIDLYWLHRDDETLPVAEILGYLNEFAAEGKIRYFGCSNWKPNRIREALNYAKSHQLKGFVGNQAMWSLASVSPNGLTDPTLVPMDEITFHLHIETGLAAVPYSSQANGYFNKLAAPGTVLNESLRRTYDNPVNRGRLERIKALCGELSLSTTQIVLGYLLSQPFTTIPVVGCHTVEQLRDSMSAENVVFDESTMRYLRDGLPGV